MFIDFNECEGDSILEKTRTLLTKILGSIQDEHFDIITTPEGSALFTVLDVAPDVNLPKRTTFIPAVYNQIGNLSCRAQFHHKEHWHYVYSGKLILLNNEKNIIPFVILGDSKITTIEVANVNVFPPSEG